MAADFLAEEEEENILYDLLVNTEWPAETDTQVCAVWSCLRFSPSSSSLPPGLVRLALLTSICFFFFLFFLFFSGQAGRMFPKDPSPQWRKVAWSHDCTLLAYADSTGTVRVFDLMGGELFIIPPAVSFPGDYSYAAAGLIFLEYTASAQWSAELLVITYGGQLKSYLVSMGTNQGFHESHTFSFSTHYFNGVTAAIYHPGHSEMTSYILSSQIFEQYQCLMDVGWWSDQALILARCSGSLTVSSVRSLSNLLGKSCEWFEPSPRVTSAHDGGFLSLECEIKLAQKRSRVESSGTSEEGDDGEEDSDSDEEGSAKARYFGYVKQGLYYVTEMERFAPPRKRPRTVTKNYRLVSLRSTTPEELYQRKIDNEEYGEALSLAHVYGLDSDLVYQRQWRKSSVSIASIQDYLSKIKKRSWVLHECVERVPENVDAAKELLQYGLKGTDLEALIAIGNGEDGGRFILPGDIDIDDSSYEDFQSVEEEMERKKERETKKRQELLKKVDFSKLTLEQKELCRSRLKLLCYLDRLATYEEILGGPHAAEQRYDSEFFKKFRNQNIVLSARTYARESNVQALDILFTYHGAELLQHRLAILCNFPETTSPHEYTVLLPEACMDDKSNLVSIPWDEQRHRDMDWCEDPQCRAMVEPSMVDDHFLYEEQPELKRFCTVDPPISLLTDWYLTRAQEIEHNSRQVDCALSLVRLGKEREIPGLELLCDDLVTMETLVYEACEMSLSLRELQQLRDIDKLRLLMKNSSEECYVKNVLQWMVPFLHRCEGQKGGTATALLRDYLVSLAREDLSLPLKIFQHSKPGCQQKIVADPDELMSVALECIYSCERDDQLALSYDILECLPQRGYGTETKATKALHDQLKCGPHTKPLKLLLQTGIKPILLYAPLFLIDHFHSECCVFQAQNPPVSESVWRDLLQDLLDMQQNVYSCLEPATCHQVFVESLLCSGREENVKLAGQLMQRSSMSQDVPGSTAFRGKAPPRVAYARSVELVLASAREYFNSSATLNDPCINLARYVKRTLQPSDTLVFANRRCDCNLMSPLTSFLLCVCLGDDEARRKGQVLTLLAEQALQCHDYKASYIHCQDLMAAGKINSVCEICVFVFCHYEQILYQAVNYKIDPSQAKAEGEDTDQVAEVKPSKTTRLDMRIGSHSGTDKNLISLSIRSVWALSCLHFVCVCVFQMEDVYSTYDYVPQEGFAEVLLRTGKLAETKSEGQHLFPATEGNTCSHARDLLFYPVILHFYERLTDFTQAQVLRGLGRGVDVQRFSSDNQYKKETILGLAECVHFYTCIYIYTCIYRSVRLDYKKLTDEDSDPLKALEPVLTSQNVLSISKLAARIPLKADEALTASAVHSTWLHKLFWEGDAHVLKRSPQTDQEYLHAYDTCAKYFDRLLPSDAVKFLDAITFSPEAACHLSVETRTEICSRALKALKAISEKSKKRSGDDGTIESSTFSFNHALTHLQQSLNHLETLGHAFPLSLRNSKEKRLQEYGRQYDLSRSDRGKVQQLAVTMSLDGQPLERIEQLLGAAVHLSDLQPRGVVQEAVQRIISSLRYSNTVTLHLCCLSYSAFQSIRLIQCFVCMLFVCTIVLKKICLSFLFQCEMKDIENEEKRYSLFLELLESSRKWEEFQHLMLLLQAWPPTTNKSRLESEQNPWVGLTAALLTHGTAPAGVSVGGEVVAMCRSLYTTKHKLSPQCIGHISSLLLSAGLKLAALKLMAESRDEQLLKLTLDQIKGISEVSFLCMLFLLLTTGQTIGTVLKLEQSDRKVNRLHKQNCTHT
uniref:NBAS subunit of NRZ tethering complex n=1 Tax=Astyanax mexicanus TaxID=7994 RepID=A0A8B9GME1_ASTMX